MQRRTLIGLATAVLTTAMLPPAAAHPTWEGLRRMRRPRARLRRRVHVRWVGGRALWVVPIGLAVGWELLHEERVVVVRATRTAVPEGDRGGQREWATVADAAGKTHEVEILREDTA